MWRNREKTITKIMIVGNSGKRSHYKLCSCFSWHHLIALTKDSGGVVQSSRIEAKAAKMISIRFVQLQKAQRKKTNIQPTVQNQPCLGLR
jgi:hypothetical protein